MRIGMVGGRDFRIDDTPPTLDREKRPVPGVGIVNENPCAADPSELTRSGRFPFAVTVYVTLSITTCTLIEARPDASRGLRLASSDDAPPTSAIGPRLLTNDPGQAGEPAPPDPPAAPGGGRPSLKRVK